MKRTCGIVLAAGASSRMGRPKALLPMPDGRPLAAQQAALLRAAGCDPVVIVLGAEAARIRAELVGETIVENPLWLSGRFSSIQAGIRACPDAEGFFLLPVDTVGVARATIEQVLQHAAVTGAVVVRPCFRGEPGRVLWISAAVAWPWAHEAPADIRMDERIRGVETRIEIEDPALLRNVNTPDAWRAVMSAETSRDSAN